MANQPEVSQFDAGVYQIETTDPVQGGVGGKTNEPLLNLANRTKWLKDQVDGINASLPVNYPVIKPSLNLDFARSRSVDSRVTFTRASAATVVGPDGLIRTVAANEPRLDYDPISRACKGLLIEEARTNLLLNSNEFFFTNANFANVNNAFIAPDGTMTADLIESINTVLPQQLSNGLPFVTYPAGDYTFSIYVYLDSAWSNPFTLIELLFLNGGSVIRTASTSLAGIDRDRWVRVHFTTNVPSDFNSIQLNRDDNLQKKAYLWGRQLEQGSFPTSYIPTTTSQVTRARDTAFIQGFLPWYRSDEGTLFVDADSIPGLTDTNSIYGVISLSNGTGAEEIYVTENDAGLLNGFFTQVYAQGAVTADLSGGSIGDDPFRYALALKKDDMSAFRNGVFVRSDTSNLMPSGISRLDIGGGRRFNAAFNGHFRQIKYYPARLPDAQIQTITAL